MGLTTREIWELVHAERRQLADDLAALTAPQWETPSLCEGWSVHDVLAHLLETARVGRLAFVWSMVRAKGDFDRANENGVRRYRRADPGQTLADFRAASHLRKTPPAHRATRLVEAIVHGEDIRRPLGITADYPSAAIQDALEYQLRTPSSFGGSRERTDGLRLVDVETGHSWGTGSEVTGAGVDLLLAACGRPLDHALLSGPGAPRLVAQGA
ncbi:maleylpyruvate isomerase family mycothiol-dependent enzyme [Ruania halotolerans]|uniref:maleylpyruvate isomerase family mycothiol-dependent enzyme n=1 Tax=Ruania halotolerans TaxID=2897773 RepID=UPI001E58F92B|nr:maleylpyruvate isomerase family mycothiol-dependent enzyme [Ruania halotolerans]UFU06781.1 maleylpyruvate isomerase family mycothiol-dependent enzyme [Ruania halotolerans]